MARRPTRRKVLPAEPPQQKAAPSDPFVLNAPAEHPSGLPVLPPSPPPLPFVDSTAIGLEPSSVLQPGTQLTQSAAWVPDSQTWDVAARIAADRARNFSAAVLSTPFSAELPMPLHNLPPATHVTGPPEPTSSAAPNMIGPGIQNPVPPSHSVKWTGGVGQQSRSSLAFL
jgi:hypothetical protein